MKKSILIVDDDQSICKTTSKVLGGKYVTFTASNGREALDILNQKERIDLVLIDMMMPEINGVELLERLRFKNKDIAVIMMSGYFTIDSALESMNQGAYTCISKPFDFDRLEMSIQNALHKD